MDLTQYLISFTAIMFMLSLVSERLSNFLKLYFHNKNIYIPFVHTKSNALKFFLKVKLDFLGVKSINRSIEKDREYRIMTINIIVGILLATFVNANFFDITTNISNIPNTTEKESKSKDSVYESKSFQIIKGWQIFQNHEQENNTKRKVAKEDTTKESYTSKIILGAVFFVGLLWSISLLLFVNLREFENYIQHKFILYIPLLLFLLVIPAILICAEVYNIDDFLVIYYHILSFTITGLFISLGSKFWHDFLDLLLKIKNTQRSINDPNTYKNITSVDKLIALVNTPYYEITDKLYAKYKEQLKKIDDVVSIGYFSELDKNDGFFKRLIEVEYTSAYAQNQLELFIKDAFVIINENYFYLKDFIKLRYTSQIIALTDFIHEIKNVEKICYAYNLANKGLDIYGSFSVTMENGEYYAESNLHVFASKTDFENIRQNESIIINDEEVCFIINNKEYKGKIDQSECYFGNTNNLKDYCKCKIGKEMYVAYNSYIKPNNLISTLEPGDWMKMNGATSKEISLSSLKEESTWVHINYNGFKKGLYLFKVMTNSLEKEVQKGDSGSKIYFKSKDSTVVKEAILVGKSDSYAYIFKK